MNKRPMTIPGSELKVGDQFKSVWFTSCGPGTIKSIRSHKPQDGDDIASVSFEETHIEMTVFPDERYSILRDRQVSKSRGLRALEKDESAALRDLSDQMNRLHAQMGGRDSRPERKALVKCMRLIEKAIEEVRAGK